MCVILLFLLLLLFGFFVLIFLLCVPMCVSVKYNIPIMIYYCVLILYDHFYVFYVFHGYLPKTNN